MTKNIKCVVDVTTGQQSEITMTADEIALEAKTQLATENNVTKIEAEKEAATAKLTALGLSVDDLKAIGL
jgi:hypothetical protein